MSLSNPDLDGGNRPPNPAGKLFLQWQGSEGYWFFYDKDAPNPDPAKKGNKISLGTNIIFIVLDQLNTIKGFNQKEAKFVWSNEVRNTQTDLMEVSVGSTPIAKGFYKEIKELANSKQGDYVKSVYAAMKDPSGKLIIVNIALTGASLGPWIEFTKTCDLSKGCVKVTGFTNEVTGAVKFVAPTFQFFPLTPEQMQPAADLDANILQPYLLKYFTFAPDNTPIAAPVQQAAQSVAPAQAASWGAPVNNSLSSNQGQSTDFSMQPQGQNNPSGVSAYNPAPKDDGMGWGKPVENIAPPVATNQQMDSLPF